MSANIVLLSRLLAGVAAVCAVLQSSANAQEKLKVEIITTLSAAAGAVLGQQLRNGFELAVKTLGGKLGGRDTEILVADDELKPDVAVTKVKAMIDRDKVDFVVGPDILQHPRRHREAGHRGQRLPDQSQCRHRRASPARTATRTSSSRPIRTIKCTRCSAQYAQESGIKKVIIIVPNYQAGKDAAAGFKHKFTGRDAR